MEDYDDTDGVIGNTNEYLEENLLKINELQSLYNLHHDIWDETLLEPPFRFYYERLLHPRERQVVDGRIKGKTNEQIAEEMGIESVSVQRYIYAIRYIFRNKARKRVNKFWNFRNFKKLSRRKL